MQVDIKKEKSFIWGFKLVYLIFLFSLFLLKWLKYYCHFYISKSQSVAKKTWEWW